MATNSSCSNSSSRQCVSAGCQRSQSESDSFGAAAAASGPAVDGRFVRLTSLNEHPCASPSLKRVITKNVVQMRRQEYERINRNFSDSGVTSGRQVKSDSCVGLASSSSCTAHDQDKQPCSTPEAMIPKIASKPDSARIRRTISTGFQRDVKTVVRESNLQSREKPLVQPKPSQIQRQNLNSEISSLCASNNVKLSADFQNSLSLKLHGKDGNNNCKSPGQKERESSSVVLGSSSVVLGSSSVVLGKSSTSAPVPPPKPPRCLSELGFALESKLSKEFQSADGKYDFLANTVSGVFAPALTGRINASEHKCEVTESTPTYATTDEVMSSSLETETKMPQKSEKEKKSHWKSSFHSIRPGKKKKRRHGKTIQIDNPDYMRGHSSDTDEVIPCRPLVRRLSENDLDRKNVFKPELIYDEPYACVNDCRQESLNLDPIPVAFDGQGYAVPDLENNSFQKQSRVKSKVSHAYAVLRLPHETGESTQIDDAADEELQDQEQRLIYVKHVHQNTSAAIAKYERVKLNTSARLFQYGMIIGLDGNEADGLTPKTLFSIPIEVPSSDSFVCNFCFPEVDLWSPQRFHEEFQRFHEGELFSFVLTSETGDRRYGWCKRYLPPGSGPRLPEALCIVSTLGECGMYEQLLRALQEFRSHSMECAKDLMEVAYARPMPAANKEVYIRTEIPGRGRQTIILKRILNSALSIVPYSRLLDHLPVSVLLEVFGALLLERKIIFCANGLNALSSCMGAMVALLHPFEWQHTYVTVLTMSLIDIVEAPTPYIVGILTSMKPHLEDHDLSEVLLVDLDNGCIVKGIGDESRIIPKKIQRALSAALLYDEDSDVQNGTSQKNRLDNDATISEAFSRLFVETCAHYRDFILEQEGEETTFQREQFVKAVHSRSIRLFLDWFTQTQMFEVFMSGRLNQNAIISDDFDKRIDDYRDEMESTAKSNLGRGRRKKSLGEKISDFFRVSGHKIKRTFQNVYV